MITFVIDTTEEEVQVASDANTLDSMWKHIETHFGTFLTRECALYRTDAAQYDLKKGTIVYEVQVRGVVHGQNYCITGVIL